MSIEQEFADKLVQYKHIIYKVCFMYADNKIGRASCRERV